MESRRVRETPKTKCPAVRPRRKLRRRFLFRLGIVSVLIVCLLYGFRAQLLPSLARFLDVSQPPEAADYVFVLAGNLEARPFVAAALWRAGLTKHIVITTPKKGPPIGDGNLLSQHEILRRVLFPPRVPGQGI